MFGEVNFHLNWVYAFNNELTCLFQNPTPEKDVDPKKKKAGILLDASGSMRNLQSEVKLMLSALKCMTGTIGMFNAPTPENGTKIIDSVDELWGDDKLEDLDQLIVITDGYDTSSVAERIIKCITDGKAEYTVLPTMPATNKFSKWLAHHRDGEHASVVVPDEYDALPAAERAALVEEFHAWHQAALDLRGAAVAAHLDALGIDMTVVGVGTEVKGFIAECAKPGRGLRTAYIDRGADAEAVGSIISTVATRKPRKRTSTVADETVIAGTATALSEREVTAVKSEALRTSTAAERKSNPDLLIDGAAFDPTDQRRYVHHIVTSELRKERPDATDADMERMAALVIDALELFRYFLHLNGGAPLSSAIFGSPSWPSGKKLPSGEPDGTRKCALLEVPEIFGDLKPSRWTHMIMRLIELLARNPSAIEDRLKTPFNDEFKAMIASNRVGPMFRHAGKPASHVAISYDFLPHEDLRTRTLYFKFKAETYDHFILHHRDTDESVVSPRLHDQCRIAQAGNSSAKSYGGPALPPPEAPAPAPARARAPAAPTTTTTVTVAEEEETTGANDVGDPDASPPASPAATAAPAAAPKRGRPASSSAPTGEWGCSRCRWRERGCKAKRCKPNPDAPRKRRAPAAAAEAAEDSAAESPASQASAVSEEPQESAASGDEGSSPTHSSEAESSNAPIANDPRLLPEENNRLKRKVSELEKDNSALEGENAQLKSKLAAIGAISTLQ